MMTKQKISSGTVQHARVPEKRMRRIALAALVLLAVCMVLMAPAVAASPELITDIGSKDFIVGVPVEFNYTTKAGDHAGYMVLGSSNFNDASAIQKLEYYETQNGQWLTLDGSFGNPETGFPLINDATSKFRVTFNKVGTYTFTSSICNQTSKDVYCSVVATANVREFKPSELSTDIGSKKFVVGEPVEFTFTTTANDDVGKMVLGSSTFSDTTALQSLQYYENDMWINYPFGFDFGDGEQGFPMSNAASKFKVTFAKAGTYSFTAVMKSFDSDDILCSTEVKFNVFGDADIGETHYTTLAEAVAAVPKDGTKTTITLLKDAEGAGIVTDEQNVIIDFGGFTYTINELVGSSKTVTNGFQLLKGSDVELKNGKIAVSEDVSAIACILIQNYANLTLSDITLDGSNLANNHDSTGYCYTLSNNCGDVSIGNGVTIIADEGQVAFDVCYSSKYDAGSHVTVESGATINGLVAFDVWTGDAATNPASSLRINGGTFNGNLVVDEPLTDAAKSLIVIYGGTFSSNPSAYIASGMEVVQPGDKYLVQEYVDRSSSSSSSVKPEEPEQPEEPVVEPETPAAPGEVASSTEVTDGGEVAFETTVVDEETGEQSAPAAADSEIKGVVLPTGTEGTVEFVPVSEQAAPAGEEENTKRVFEINVQNYEKGKAAVIKFQMTVAELAADGKTAEQVALWHFDEETGEWTKLVTTFTIVDGIVYFEAITEDFSPFAIIYEDEPAGDMPGDEPETPETPESPAPLLGVLAALGAAVVLRRK